MLYVTAVLLKHKPNQEVKVRIAWRYVLLLFLYMIVLIVPIVEMDVTLRREFYWMVAGKKDE